METYVILRRHGWRSVEDLTAAGERSVAAGDEMTDEVRWIRSYMLDDGVDSVGTVCVYEAASPEVLRSHAKRADLPIDEIIPVLDTVVVRPDPVSAPG